MLLRDARTLLGVGAGISPRELRSRYRNLIKQLHPDGGGGDTRRLNEVLEAYRIVQRQLDMDEIRGDRSRRGTEERHAGTTEKRDGRDRSAPRRTDGVGGEHDRTPSIKDDPRLLFTYGRWATGSKDPAVRRLAVRRIAQSGLTAAQVFLKQAVFDTDRSVAVEAAIGLTRINGSRTVQTILSLFDDLSPEQRLAIVQETAVDTRRWFRVLAYAEADHYAEVRKRAATILRTMGER